MLINFDRHALLNLIRKAAGKFVAIIEDIRPQFRVAETKFLSQTAIFESSVLRGGGVPVDATTDLA